MERFGPVAGGDVVEVRGVDDGVLGSDGQEEFRRVSNGGGWIRQQESAKEQRGEEG